MALNQTIASLVADKRTDVVLRLEQENTALKASVTELNISLFEMKAFKVSHST